MPPRARITREMIVDAALEIARQDGAEKINARTVADRLGCSTQPVMYHFATIDELKRAAYAAADRLHTEYLLRQLPETDPILAIGLNYIRFAGEEPQLFRFLFQSGYAPANSLAEMIDAPELLPVLRVMREGTGLDMKKTKEVFLIVGLFAHGYACMLANNGMRYDRNLIAAQLEQAFAGAVLAAEREENP